MHCYSFCRSETSSLAGELDTSQFILLVWSTTQIRYDDNYDDDDSDDDDKDDDDDEDDDDDDDG